MPIVPKISRRALALALSLATLSSAGLAVAHHSFAMFDFSRLETLKGTVKEFHWANPHVILWVDVKEASGGLKPGVWFAELTSPGNLTRVGWNKRVFQAGDRIELELHPLRDGKSGGAFKKGTLPDTGKVWTSNLREQEKPGLK